jgi:hypothetical protein
MTRRGKFLNDNPIAGRENREEACQSWEAQKMVGPCHSERSEESRSERIV